MGTGLVFYMFVLYSFFIIHSMEGKGTNQRERGGGDREERERETELKKRKQLR